MASFNAKYPGDMDVKTLKGLWKRVKEKAKKDLDQERREKRKTGGGLPVSKIDKITDGVSAVLGESILPLQNVFDDDDAGCSKDHAGDSQT